VGYDDYSDIRLSGAQTAAPIWAEFMKKGGALPQYSDVKPFNQPEGVVDVQLDKITNRLATPSCPDDYTIAFVAGTEPHDTCDQTRSAGLLLAHLRWKLGERRCLRPPRMGTRSLPPVSNPKKRPRRRKASSARL
jgi:penicillin-binding protein 1B